MLFETSATPSATYASTDQYTSRHSAFDYDRDMIHVVIPVGPLQCNCSIVGDEVSREAIVIDPGDEIEELVKILDKHKLRVKQIVVTHAHIDHVGGATKLKQRTGAPVLL